MAKISVVIPTRNEQESIVPLLKAISASMVGIEHEVLVVDDSDDNRTAALALANDARVIRGQHKGLGQAIIDGINASEGNIVVNMDADGQHAPQDIPKLIKPIMEHGVDFVVGSRYCEGGDASNWSRSRRLKSKFGVYMMLPFVGVRDANSGFFCLRKSIVEGINLNGNTWKIMLEILFKGKWISKLEVPIKFGDRYAGESKRSNKQVYKDAINIAKLVIYKYRRFINFALVGGIGSIWYYAALYLLTEYADIWYGWSALVGTVIALTNNYLINHFYTFRHVKENNRSLFKGWLKYVGNSAIGDGIDWCILILLTEVFGIWYMLSAFLSSGVACIIKYFIASKFIWGNKSKNRNDADYEWVSFYKGLPWQKRWKQKLAGIVRNMVGEAGKVLELGCGSSPLGVLTNHTDYIGIDRNQSKIEYMKAKGLGNCLFRVRDVTSIDYRDKVFDTVLFIEVIEHLENLETAKKTLWGIHHVLKDGGQAIIATPNFGSWTGRMQDWLYGVFQKGAYQEEHTLKFDLSGLIYLCSECGLKYDYSIIPMGSDMVCRFTKASQVERG